MLDIIIEEEKRNEKEEEGPNSEEERKKEERKKRIENYFRREEEICEFNYNISMNPDILNSSFDEESNYNEGMNLERLYSNFYEPNFKAAFINAMKTAKCEQLDELQRNLDEFCSAVELMRKADYLPNMINIYECIPDYSKLYNV